jgi:hypothetical protein
MEGRVTPRVKKLMFNKLLVTAEVLSSSIILTKDDNTTKTIKEVQTVVLTGPFCSQEGGSGIEVGDRVVLDPLHLKATQVAINKHTGEYVAYGSKVDKEDIDMYLLINDRDVVAILEDEKLI